MAGNLVVGLLALLLLASCSSNPVLFGEEPEGRPPGELTPGPIDEMTYAYVPAGSFQMGSPVTDPDSQDDERPVHTIIFSYDFEMMTTEVTQAMWEEVMGSNPSHFPGEDRPVEQISWNDCQVFVEAINALDPLYAYRLPSEAEWEYCCRAGTTTRYSWGEDSLYVSIDEYAWYRANSLEETHPVGEKLANSWGLYDMSGNVWEWCQDCWHDDYSGAPSNGSAWQSPSSPYRVGRGASWGYDAQFCRSANRGVFDTEYSCNYVGFRLVRSLK